MKPNAGGQVEDEPPFDYDEPASAIELYAGVIRATEATDFAGPGRISVEWGDGPQVRVEFLRRRIGRGTAWGHHFDAMPSGEGPWRLALEDGRTLLADMIQWDFSDDVIRSSGLPVSPEFGDGSAMTTLETQLVNAPFVNRDEVWLVGGGWRVHVYDARDMRTGPRSLATYFLTAKLSLERDGRRRFDARVGEELLDCLMNFLSLARGAWVGHVTLSGRNRVGRQVWERWKVARADHSDKGSDWALEYYPRETDHEAPVWDPYLLRELWNGFSSRWNRADLGPTMRALTAMYIQAESHTEGEAGLVIAQTVLELLSWLLVVDERAMLSADGHNKLTAADRIRLLLSVVGQEPSVPPGHPGLAKVAEEYKWFDGPQAVTEIRNGLVHPIRRQKLTKVSAQALEEARSLSMFYARRAMVYWLAPSTLESE